MTTTSKLRSQLFPYAPARRKLPSARRARTPCQPEHYYVGCRLDATEVYVVGRNTIEPLEPYGYRSDAPFDWGAPTDGALELSYAMLAHSTESKPPDPICAAFLTEVVAGLDRAGFVLAHGEIALWLLTAFCEGEKPLKRRRSVRDYLHRIRPWGQR